MKRLIFIIIAYALLLPACVSDNADTATVGGTLSTVFAPTGESTDGDEFPVSREDIIEANLSIPVGDTEGMAVWAEEWIRQYYDKYEPYDIKAKSASSSFAPSSVNVLDGMKAGCVEYTVSFRTSVTIYNLMADDEGYMSQKVDVYWVNDGESTYLSDIQRSGMQWDYSLSSYDRLYDAISGDTRFASGQNPRLHTTMGEGITEYVISYYNDEMLPAPVMPAEGILAYRTDTAGENNYYDFDISFFDYKKSNEIKRVSFKSEKDYPYLAVVDDGALRLEFNYTENDKYITESRKINLSGDVLDEAVYDNDNRSFYLEGGACIVRRDSNLYYYDEANGTERLLMTGKHTRPEEYGTSTEWCDFYAPLDGNRFIYIVHGYEWIVRTGVYDVSDFSDHVFTYDGKTHMYLMDMKGDKLFSSNASYDEFTFADRILVTDLSKGYETVMPYADIPGLKRAVLSFSAISPDGSSICVILDNGFGVTVAVVDDSGIKRSWDIESTKCSINKILYFGSDKVIVYGNAVYKGDYCLYELYY